jgi:hypothetical protein
LNVRRGDSMEDVWVETVHETERRDGKKNNSVAVKKEKASAQERKKPLASSKDDHGQERKRSA